MLLPRLLCSAPKRTQGKEVPMASSRPLPSVLALVILSLTFEPSCSHTVAVNGLSKSTIPFLHVGDSLVFKEVGVYDLYMFHSRRVFDLCVFVQASLLHSTRGSGASHFTWHPSRPGNYYFLYRNVTLNACHGGRRVEVTVLPASQLSPTPSPLPAPPPTAGDDNRGGFFPSLPHDRRFTAPSPSPDAVLLHPGNGNVGESPPVAGPSAFPVSGGGFPFISSNPALPLPTGEADSATTSRPLPVVGDGQQAVGMGLGIQTSAFLSLTSFALWGF